MGIVHSLGEGYYGVDASNVSIEQESLDRIREMSNHARSIPDDAIQITSYKPEQRTRDVGFSHFRVTNRQVK